jgi:hypothetical protein
MPWERCIIGAFIMSPLVCIMVPIAPPLAARLAISARMASASRMPDPIAFWWAASLLTFPGGTCSGPGAPPPGFIMGIMGGRAGIAACFIIASRIACRAASPGAGPVSAA